MGMTPPTLQSSCKDLGDSMCKVFSELRKNIIQEYQAHITLFSEGFTRIKSLSGTTEG